MKKVFRMAILLLVFVMLISIFGCQRKVDEYPARAIDVVIPFGVGGASDISARQFAKIAEKYVGVPINCVNKGGSGTVEGLEYAYSQPADGYTVFELTTSVIMKEAQNAASIKFTETFDPLLMMMKDFQIYCVKKGNDKFQTLDEMINYGKNNPGDIKIAGISAGACDDCTQSLMAKGLGIEFTYVPYKSGSEIKAAILGDEIDLVQDKVASILPLIESGDLIPLILVCDKRVDAIPVLQGVPCAGEFGISGTPIAWRCFAVRKDVPQERKDFLLKAFTDAFNDEDFIKFKETRYLNLLDVDKTPEAIRKTWEKELESYIGFYKETGLIN